MTSKQLQSKADKKNMYKQVDPQSTKTRYFDEGWKDGYKFRNEEIKLVSEKELLAKFKEVTDAAICVKIAKEYQWEINVEDLRQAFADWYFEFKNETGQPPLAMQIFFWFENNLK